METVIPLIIYSQILSEVGVSFVSLFFSHKAKYIIIEDTNFILEAVQKHFYYFIQLCPFLWLIYKTPSIIIKIFLNPFTKVLKPYYYIFLIRCVIVYKWNLMCIELLVPLPHCCLDLTHLHL